MIYLDNAATSYPKPQSVRKAVNDSFLYSANPGRSGHDMSITATNQIYKCRVKASEMFGANSPENIIFTVNCTNAANMVIKGILTSNNDHVVVSDMEHNAVMRPIKSLESRGITSTIVKISEDDDETLARFREALRPNTKIVICNHVSNVWGIKLPVERISAMCHQYGIPIMIDASQSAGLFNINVTESKFDFVCMPGHKGLYAPLGTGILIAQRPELLKTIIEGGTGSGSRSFEQPNFPPDKFESGTPNLHGIAGLSAGLDFVKKIGENRLLAHENKILTQIYDTLSQSKKITFYTKRPNTEHFGGVLSFNYSDWDSEETARRLNSKGIAVRAGLHCSPLAHEHFGTIHRGAVRVSPSYFTTAQQASYFCSLFFSSFF